MAAPYPPCTGEAHELRQSRWLRIMDDSDVMPAIKHGGAVLVSLEIYLLGIRCQNRPHPLEGVMEALGCLK